MPDGVPMPDLTLHGNSVPCSACEGRGSVPDGDRLTPIDGGARAAFLPAWTMCRACRGLGRVPRPVEDIIAEMRGA